MEDKFEYQVYDTERAKKIDGIEGLVELMSAYNERNIYIKAYQDYQAGQIDDKPARPNINLTEMRKKYPRAAAYLDAKNWSMDAHPKKVALGKQAMNRLQAGEDPEVVMEEIELAWAAFKVAQEG